MRADSTLEFADCHPATECSEVQQVVPGSIGTMASKLKTATPVIANAGVDAWYRTQLQTIVLDMSRDLLLGVKKAWRDGGGIATDAHGKRSTPMLLRLALERWGGLWATNLETMSDRIALSFANKSKEATEAGMRRSLSKAGFTIRFKPSRRSVEAYDAIIASNVGLIRSIPQRYLGDVQNVVWDGVMSGADLRTMSTELQQKYEIAHRRAALIARDQNHKAKASMERARRLENGLTQAVWQHSHGGVEPRPTHVDMDGKVYDIREGMYDSAVDKQIWPGTEINCRCTDRAVIPGFG